MKIRFVYIYFMADVPARVRSIAPQHVEHWHYLNLEDYIGGPFADRSGGLITFVVDEPAQAEAAVEGDPFVQGGLLERYWLKEWSPRNPEGELATHGAQRWITFPP
jgi:uncharacterized protein YciI